MQGLDHSILVLSIPIFCGDVEQVIDQPGIRHAVQPHRRLEDEMGREVVLRFLRHLPAPRALLGLSLIHI